jgi:Protein of unknown function (DUF2442)
MIRKIAMSLLRIKQVVPVSGYRLRLTLTDGSTLERDVENLLVGPVFEPIRRDPGLFRQVRVENGTVTWPGDVRPLPRRAHLARTAARGCGEIQTRR